MTTTALTATPGVQSASPQRARRTVKSGIAGVALTYVLSHLMYSWFPFFFSCGTRLVVLSSTPMYLNSNSLRFGRS